MKRQFLLSIVLAGVYSLLIDGGKAKQSDGEKVKDSEIAVVEEVQDVKDCMTTEDYCSMDEFEDLNYYLFCDTQLHAGAGGFTF